MQGQAGKRKTDGKVPSNTEQNCPDLFERPRFVCIMQAPLVQMRTVPSETGHFPKVISLNGSCSRCYLLSMPHIRSYLIRCPTENFRDAAPCGEITIFLVHSTLPLEWFTPSVRMFVYDDIRSLLPLIQKQLLLPYIVARTTMAGRKLRQLHLTQH